MSELIRREDALKAIEARAYDLESTDSINTAYGCRLGGDVVRALPAIGTCKDCAAWSNSGVCRMVFPPAGWVHSPTEPDFFCAAWSPKEAQPNA